MAEDRKPDLTVPDGDDLIMDESGYPIGSAPKPKPPKPETLPSD